MNAEQATAIVQLLTGTIESEGTATRKVLAAVQMSDPAAIAKWHQAHLTERLARLRAMPPEQMLRDVEFFGMKGPACTWLAMMNNHSVHHRGQLAAYLRAAGSKVPAIYGMSADENAFG